MQHARTTARPDVRPMTPEEFTRGMSKGQLVDRLEAVKTKLKARTDRDGKPRVGFKENVAMLKTEITRLEGLVAPPKKS